MRSLYVTLILTCLLCSVLVEAVPALGTTPTLPAITRSKSSRLSQTTQLTSTTTISRPTPSHVPTAPFSNIVKFAVGVFSWAKQSGAKTTKPSPTPYIPNPKGVVFLVPPVLEDTPSPDPLGQATPVQPGLPSPDPSPIVQSPVLPSANPIGASPAGFGLVKAVVLAANDLESTTTLDATTTISIISPTASGDPCGDAGCNTDAPSPAVATNPVASPILTSPPVFMTSPPIIPSPVVESPAIPSPAIILQSPTPSCEDTNSCGPIVPSPIPASPDTTTTTTAPILGAGGAPASTTTLCCGNEIASPIPSPIVASPIVPSPVIPSPIIAFPLATSPYAMASTTAPDILGARGANASTTTASCGNEIPSPIPSPLVASPIVPSPIIASLIIASPLATSPYSLTTTTARAILGAGGAPASTTFPCCGNEVASTTTEPQTTTTTTPCCGKEMDMVTTTRRTTTATNKPPRTTTTPCCGNEGNTPTIRKATATAPPILGAGGRPNSTTTTTCCDNDIKPTTTRTHKTTTTACCGNDINATSTNTIKRPSINPTHPMMKGMVSPSPSKMKAMVSPAPSNKVTGTATAPTGRIPATLGLQKSPTPRPTTSSRQAVADLGALSFKTDINGTNKITWQCIDHPTNKAQKVLSGTIYADLIPDGTQQQTYITKAKILCSQTQDPYPVTNLYDVRGQTCVMTLVETDSVVFLKGSNITFHGLNQTTYGAAYTGLDGYTHNQGGGTIFNTAYVAKANKQDDPSANLGADTSLVLANFNNMGTFSNLFGTPCGSPDFGQISSHVDYFYMQAYMCLPAYPDTYGCFSFVNNTALAPSGVTVPTPPPFMPPKAGGHRRF
ncbi:hypothetical protein SmJEL517_g01610 [Synchytrium microbalum]|uniref:Uncharacterized protein n=1 Tax=Synchytrium microbalum TaxID=1806994 RepID=A0A507C9I5_9FUNG|nr:uncharacterized protein SmJEL517_g01610 [Synchytrium microbalum]TPX36141.1 hypothetical protein SmJEL517_g01610 [Synchytrium microbalum]